MSELTREQIEDIREDGPALITAGAWIALCDMALRTLDAEARADRLQQEAEIHAGEAVDEMLDELKQFADVGSERTADPVGARSRIGELARTLRKALSRTSDEGTGCVVPEAVKVLPNMYRRKGWDLAADMLEAAIAEQGGQPEHGESDARD